MSRKVVWPRGAKFAVSIFDDTDNSTIENTKPVYEYLLKKGIYTTKSVWVYQPRGAYSGSSLSDPAYLDWIKRLQRAGVEIGLHNVGDGYFTRKEILDGLEMFERWLGKSPFVHCNHVSNPDNLYWWNKRFVWPIGQLYKIAYRLKKRKGVPAGGDLEGSDQFWGDAAKQKIKFVRNLTFAGINTLSRDPEMPWKDQKKKYVNYWFSSSDGHNVRLFNDLLAPKNLEELEASGGACIVYTHFASGFVDDNGALDPLFKERIDDLASRGGWFVPCGELLEYLLNNKEREEVGFWYRFSLNIVWIIERFKKMVKYRM